MPFLTQGKTNWKYILIVLFLAIIVVGGILGYQYWWVPKEEVKLPDVKGPEGKPPEEVTPKEKAEALEESLEINPYDADIPYCRNSRGVKYSTTGPESASWFVWGGCAHSKFYNVTPGEELLFRIYTDSCAGCVCYHPNFSIYEYREENWEKAEDFDLPDVKGITENVFYTPS
jgi:hypothetical protein